VLAVVPGLAGTHPHACPSCAALFEVTVRGLREEAGQDVQTAALLQLATDAYDAQHLGPGEPAATPVRLCPWLVRDADPRRAAELAADLDVVDLPTLVRAWADAVWTDWAPAHATLRSAADAALTS